MILLKWTMAIQMTMDRSMSCEFTPNSTRGIGWMAVNVNLIEYTYSTIGGDILIDARLIRTSKTSG